MTARGRSEPPSNADSHTRRRLRAYARTSVPASMAMNGSRVTTHQPAYDPRNAPATRRA